MRSSRRGSNLESRRGRSRSRKRSRSRRNFRLIMNRMSGRLTNTGHSVIYPEYTASCYGMKIYPFIKLP